MAQPEKTHDIDLLSGVECGAAGGSQRRVDQDRGDASLIPFHCAMRFIRGEASDPTTVAGFAGAQLVSVDGNPYTGEYT